MRTLPPHAHWNHDHWEISESLRLQPTDRALLHGLGLFETILATHHQPRFLSWHLERLQHSASQLHWNFPNLDWKPAIQRLFQSLDSNDSKHSTHRLRLTLTGGSGPLTDLSPGTDAAAFISLSPLAPAPPSLAVMISPWTRNTADPLTGLKSTSYAANLIALDHARRHGFQEALFLNQHGDLCEAATANLFLLLGGHWHTPPLASGCLPGVCRRWMVETAAIETRLTVTDLARADAIVLTSATRGPTPVHQLGDRQLLPHPATAILREAWLSAVGMPAE